MSIGGYRPGSGRKKGSTTRLNRSTAEQLATGGVMPLTVMVETMRLLWAADKKLEACAIAEKAAPYMHPRLSAVEHSGDVKQTYVIRAPAPVASVDEWQQQRAPQTSQIIQ